MDDQEKQEQLQHIAKKVLSITRDYILLNMRFLGMALSKLKESESEDYVLATNGEYLYYNPYYFILAFKKSKESVLKGYLHSLMHCIYLHMYANSILNRTIWNLACDIAVANTISEFHIMTEALSFEEKQIIQELKTKVNVLTAEKIYHYYMNLQLSDEELEKLHDTFQVDDHSPWYPENRNQEGNQEDNQGVEGQSSTAQSTLKKWQSNLEDWKNISQSIQEELTSFSKQRGSQAGSMMQNLQEVHRERYDYTKFLKKFACLGEMLKVNDDEFDDIFYTYGIKLYENMPLIEPLEYKEVKRIKEFVIAIDTSGSVVGETVQNFLQKTYNILQQEESFFTKINLHIIQCDAAIQEDQKITSREEFNEYIKHMTIKGLGGTDFRPIFQYVEELQKKKEFVNLKGLIYFTDGWGVFPKKQPDYKTAFVFLDDGTIHGEIPVWAIKLILPIEDLL